MDTEAAVKKTLPLRGALILRSAALFAVLYQFRLLAADLADTPVFLASLLAAFAAAVVLARRGKNSETGKRRPLGTLPALAIIALAPWTARLLIALPRIFVPGPAAALDSLLLNWDRNNFVSLLPFYWAAGSTWFSLRSRNFLRGDIIAGAVLLLAIYSAARTGDIALYRWPVLMIAVFGGIAFLQLGALLLSLPPAVRLRPREALPAALTLLLLVLLGGLLFLRPSQERAVEKGGGLLEPNLFRFDFSRFLKLESEISMSGDLALILKKDAGDDHIFFRRHVLSGYSANQGFFRLEDLDEKTHPQRTPSGPLRLPGKAPVTDSRIVNQEIFLVNFDASAFIGLNDPFAVIPYETRNAASFSAAYGVQSYAGALFNPFELMDAGVWPPGPESLGLSAEEYRIYTEYGGDERIRALALEITGELSAYWEKVQAVYEYLKFGDYRYSLKPGIAPDGDQLGFFLFTAKRGYCSYYAFSMALLLRSLGIPARVAAGFFIDPSTNTFGYYPVRSDMAHAWVEVPFPGYGWVEYDPTTDQLSEGEEFRFSTGVDQELFERLMKEILENHGRLRPMGENADAGSTPDLSSLIRRAGAFFKSRWPLPLLLLLAALFLFLRCGPLFASRLARNSRQKAIRLWGQARRRLRLAGFRRGAFTAEAEWARYMDARFPGLYNLYQGFAAARFAPDFNPADFRDFQNRYRFFSGAYRRIVPPLRRLLAWILPPLALLPGPGGGPQSPPGRDRSGGAGNGKNPVPLILLCAFLLLPGGDRPGAQNQPLEADALFTGAQEAERNELWERAITLYSRGRKQYPREPRFPLALGNLYYHRGLYTLAWDEYRRAEALLPGNPGLLYQLSRCAGYLNRDRLSVDYLERLLAGYPDNREAIGSLGWMYYKVHRLGDGERLLTGAISRLGEDTDFAMTLGTIYSDLYQYDAGKQWYQTAITSGEALGDRAFTAVAHYNLSILETRFHRFDLALKETTASLASQTRASGRLARGELLIRKLDFAGALADYEAAYAIDTSPLAKINLARLYQVTGRLEEARRYAEDCLKAGDLSWMLNYGIDPVRYQRDIRELLYKIWSGLAAAESLTPYGRPGEKIRSLFRRSSCRFQAAVNRHFYRKYSLAAGDAYGPETREGGGPHLDSFIQYYSAFEGYPRRALTYLHRARAFESARIPAVTPAYDLEEGALLKKTGLIQAALTSLDPLWEGELIAAAYAGLARQETGRARRDAAENLYALNRGALRRQGIRLPVAPDIRFSGTPEGVEHTARIAQKIIRALKQGGFEPVSNNGPASRFTLTINLDGGKPGIPGLAGHIELYDREQGAALLRRTLFLKSPVMADICDFVRDISALAFTAD
jgi:hypothetical protein